VPRLEWLPYTQTDAAGFKTAGRGARRSWRPRKRGTRPRRPRTRGTGTGAGTGAAARTPRRTPCTTPRLWTWRPAPRSSTTARPRRHPRRPRRPRPRRVTGGGSARAWSGAPRASSRSAEREPPTNRAFQFRLQYEKVDSTSSRSRLRTSRFMMASISAPWRRPWPASRWWTVASHPRRALLIAP
jgi:hypothetical protein